jgi:hypothetical protein
MKNLRIPLFLLLAAALIAGAWMLVRPPELGPYSFGRRPRGVVRGGPRPRRPRRQPPRRRFGAHHRSAQAPSQGRQRTRTARDPLRRYLAAKNYKAIYERLKNSAEGQTPEGWYVMYEMLRRCATVTERTSRAPQMARPNEQKRDEFVAALAPTDPLRDKRIAAYDDVNTNRCAGMEGVTVAQADLNKMLANAAAGGDAKAQALSLEQELWAARRPRGRRTAGGATASPSRTPRSKACSASRAPAIRKR